MSTREGSPESIADDYPAEHVRRGLPTQPIDTAGSYLNGMRPPTDEQIAKAAEHGFKLDEQAKYYSKVEWDNRNGKV